MTHKQYDVVIIGAGPSGAVAGAILANKGLSVIILEKQYFPRFSIGESLLPQCMQFLQQAELEQVVIDNAAQLGFQFKNGAAFHRDGNDSAFDFTQKFTDGPGTTFQVKRGLFDKLLADETHKKGVEICYGHQVEAVERLEPDVCLSVLNEQNQQYNVNAKFLLDASGFGRVLPRLLDLEKPSNFPMRKSVFTHFEDNINDANFDRDKILITVHPEYKDIWYWLIPFADGTSSIGVVAEPKYFDEEKSESEILMDFLSQDPNLNTLLKNAKPIQDVRSIQGYSANVSQLFGQNYALLGNAGEFLDPVFSSGVTIALSSAVLAAPLIEKQLNGEQVNWQSEYADKLKYGVDTFRTFVESWYDGRFQDIIFHEQQDKNVRNMISSILAGYAWDAKNPYVSESERRVNVLAQICQS
ncbi:tryptophan 7-halogenase [Pseudoalteromonas sp. C2R02]|uniref:NAD(P)/FAD-dependent oxidoreductase n=1 Tax=Pseudoalteromonas sp. C2R02 TaxID=2841565 RepID=UPI001C089DAD|nr:NAD(P)/FAD-dependent oxidoreductase [Pseudoalteromonas sp. C2R02]MBU2970284.1 tryptophan 7-halogenase [Pseudoalteromonas sp. C2R02]